MSVGIYVDHNATTQIDPRVLAKMQAFLGAAYGNASSRDHAFGWDAAEAVEEARFQVADLMGAQPGEIVFTSGATEASNWAIKGFTQSRKNSLPAIVTCVTEHPAVLETCRQVKKCLGIKTDYLPVNKAAKLNLGLSHEVVKAAGKGLLALSMANNEIGTIHPVGRLAEMAHQSGGLVFIDLAQAVGKIPVDVRAERIDLGALSAHKLYGPKGVGALFIRSGEPAIELEPQIVGGGQEGGLRGGTLNVPGIVGFGEACRIAKLEMMEDNARIGKLRDKLESTLLAQLPDIWINGHRENRLSNTSNIGFRGVDARTLIRDMHDIAVSTKSACSSGDPSPSHVLKAIGLTDDEAYSCIRFSLGRFTTEEEINYTIEKVIASVRKLRRNSAQFE